MYYIVYKTTNLVNSKIYVGVHSTKNYLLFDGYLGCGCYASKPSSWNTSPNSIFSKALKKYGSNKFVRETLFVYPYTEEGEQQAYDKEAEIVNKEWVASDDNYNLIVGGKVGRIYDQDKKVRQYDLNGNYIKTWRSIKEANEVYKGHISEVCRYKRLTACEYQWRFDSENILKLDPVSLQRKTVYQFDLQGNLIKVWKSVTEAARQFINESSAKTQIKAVCGGKLRQAKGYFWSYKNKFMYKTSIKETAVACYTKEGVFVESFDSILEACRQLHIDDYTGITSVIRGVHKLCKDLRWRYFYGNTSNIKPLK